MIRYTTGNLLDDPAKALVNPVNCVGVMGRGLAKEFKARFPDNFQKYEAACAAAFVFLGSMFVTETGGKIIVNFPTKQHWRNPSRMAWITTGLAALRAEIIARNIRSVAVPALGCGLGGLPWPGVRMLIERYLGDLPDVDVVVYEPL